MATFTANPNGARNAELQHCRIYLVSTNAVRAVKSSNEFENLGSVPNKLNKLNGAYH